MTERVRRRTDQSVLQRPQKWDRCPLFLFSAAEKEGMRGKRGGARLLRLWPLTLVPRFRPPEEGKTDERPRPDPHRGPDAQRQEHPQGGDLRGDRGGVAVSDAEALRHGG